MKLKPVALLYVTLVLVLQSGCSQDEFLSTDVDYYRFRGPIVIWNLSLFEQLEIYVHPYREDYTTDEFYPANRLGEEVIADQDIAVVQFDQNYYITAVREQVTDGPKMLLTTAIPLPITNPYHVLMIFRDGFRLLDEWEAEQIASFPGWPEEIENWKPSENYPDGLQN